jgi:hypothetical protein
MPQAMAGDPRDFAQPFPAPFNPEPWWVKSSYTAPCLPPTAPCPNWQTFTLPYTYPQEETYMEFNPNHPIIARMAVREALRQKLSDPALPDETKAEFRKLLRHPFRIADVGDEVLVSAEGDPVAMTALDAPAAPGGTHPFIDWIMANWKQVYNIVAMILKAFGIILPPIP